MVDSFLQFGERLIAAGLIEVEQLQDALSRQRDSGVLLGETLLEMDAIHPDELIDQLTEHFGAPYVLLESFEVDPSLLDVIPVELARKFQVIPLFRDVESLAVAMVNPNDILSIEELEREIDEQLDVFFAQPDDMQSALVRCYQASCVDGEELARINDEYIDGLAVSAPSDETSTVCNLDAQDPASAGPIVRAVNLILTHAIRRGATDVHIEPGEHDTRVRCRLDGFLQEFPAPARRLHDAVVSRIKVVSNLDISESRLPQDGHFKCLIDGRTIDIRTSIVPTVLGENVVLRILDKQSSTHDFTQLGLGGVEREGFEEALDSPWGMVLVTGPTGSGKTTTLYSALHKVHDPSRHIITIEDPVESVFAGCRQIQVNAKSGLTFARGLRAVLRHDPDVVMVGEIRDGETAEIATQAALTGHLILATLHTNDAPSAVSRLVDLGVAPFLVEGSLTGVLAQRLVRHLCEYCKTPHVFRPDDHAGLRSIGAAEIDGFKATGCGRCEGVGYSGRTGIHEFMRVDDAIREIIGSRGNATAIRKAAGAAGMRSLFESGLDKVRAGVTSLDEIERVTRNG